MELNHTKFKIPKSQENFLYWW